jgi:hypothetical protein
MMGMIAGCGIQESYVLQSPLEVRLGSDRETITLPAGTRVKRTFFKEDVAWIEVYGETSVSRLRVAGGKPEVYDPPSPE